VSSVWTALTLTLPLVIAGILHMVAVQFHVLDRLAQPISRNQFGKNKTWRGFILMPMLTTCAVFIQEVTIGSWLLQKGSLLSFQQYGILFSGIALGLAYVIAELPNSYLKRRLGIAPGTQATRGRIFFIILDQADSVLGCALMARIAFQISNQVLVLCVIGGTVVHLLFNSLLYLVGLRKQPF
jgi:hypothetical protein